MKPCQDRRETLLLDVYGELPLNERPSWEKHLETCEGCRQERERMRRLLQLVKEATPSPGLSPEDARDLAGSVKRELRREQEGTWWPKRFLSIPNRLIPALAAACLLVVALGWFTMRELKAPSLVDTITNNNLEKPMMAADLDVIKNLELLEEMETLQKLVKIVDSRETSQ